MNNDISSIERLMEFGMSLAVAQQMVATMNHAIGNMATPGAGATIAQQREYFVVVDGAQAGPLSEQELRQLIEGQRVNEETLVWYRGLTAWRRVADVPEAMKFVLLSNVKK